MMPWKRKSAACENGLPESLPDSIDTGDAVRPLWKRGGTAARLALGLALVGGVLGAGSIWAQAETAPGASGAGVGVLQGRLFTAQHPDSVASNAEVQLIFRDADDHLQRISSTAGPDGSYAFPGISADPTLDYVVRVQFFGRDYLGAPISFTAGETELEYNFLVARNAESIPMDGLPDNHPQMGETARPPMAPPVRQDPLTMVVLVAVILALFGLPIISAWKREVADAQATNARPIDSLVRDIAGLDLRFERGDLEEDVYRKVRDSLFARLRESAGAGPKVGT